MKKSGKIIAASLAAGMLVTLTGCGGCNGCGGTPVIDMVTRSNWYTGTSYNGIQPTFIKGHDNFKEEKIIYDVVYDATYAKNANYSLEYKDGQFITEFYATEFDWNATDIPKGYAGENPTKEIVYVFKTELTISVQYTMKVGNQATSKWFEDKVTSVSCFRAAGKRLQPVYSTQTIKSTTPNMYQPAKLEDAYKEVNLTYENFYSFNCDKVLSYVTENDGTIGKEHDLTKIQGVLFDNSSLYIAVRSMKLSPTFSQAITLFNAAAGAADSYAVMGTDTALTDTERKNITAELEKAKLYKPTAKEGEEDKGVQSTAVNIAYNGGDLHGSAQTVWYASVTDRDNNIPRATMLKISTPLPYSLGTLIYTLSDVKSTLFNA